MRVIYGEHLNTTVSDDADPQDVFNTLKSNFPELSNGTYTVTGTGSNRTLTAVVRTGSKA